MKSYTINLKEKTEIRSLNELKTMLNYMIQNEEYELCSVIKKTIDNYDEIINEYYYTKDFSVFFHNEI